MAAVELATGYVTLAAETSQISKQIGTMFKGADTFASKAGKDMGQAMAKSFEQANAVDLDAMRKDVELAEQKITATIERNAQAQAKAKRAVQIAEAELNEKREAGRASASQLMKAEDKLSLAQQKLEAAAMAARSEQAKLTAELDQTKAAFREAETAAQTAAEGTTKAFSGVGASIKAALSGDFKGAFAGIRGDAQTAANGVEQEFTAAGAEAGDGFSDGFIEKVKGLTGAVAGLGIGLSMAEGITSGMERERLGDRLAAQINLAGPQAETAGRIAGDLYAGAWGESLDETHDAVATVMSSLPGMMNAPASAIEGITAKALDLTTAFDVDMGEAVGAVGVMMRNGLAADADQAFDLMVGSLQKVPAGFRDELFPAITEYGKHFSGLGMDGATAMGLLVRGAENGVIGVDKMGDAVKEFQIRSTDMSKATGKAYDDIGLDMQTMTTELLAGGPRAEAAFGQIIHALQGMEDPAAQSAAALALFGTPLEDLSVSEIPTFLGAMDPAGDAFDDMAGAAERMGTTLNDNAATNLESFKRTLGQGFTNVIGTASGFLLDLGGAFKPVGDFVRDTAPHWTPFAIGVGAVAVAVGAWAAAQWVAAAAVGATIWPMTATIAGIGLLVGAVIYAWQHFDGFRSVVLGVWDNIKAATALAVTWFQTTAVPWIRSALTVAGAAFTWLWRTIVQPVWNGIVAAITWAWNGFIMPVFEELTRFIREVIAPAALWLWHNVISPAFQGISTAIQWAWTTVIRPVFQALWSFMRTVLAPTIGWLWNTIVGPAFRGIGAIVQFVWENVIRIAFRALTAFLRDVLGPVITWIWKNVAKPAFEGIGNVVKWAWENVVRPAFDRFRGGLDVLGEAFAKTKDFITEQWNKLRDAVKRPIGVVVNQIINPFIRKYNDLNDWWSGDDLDEITGYKGYARGGWTGPGAKFQEAGVVHADEFVIRKESQRDISRTAPGLLDAMNKYGASALGFAHGGLVGARHQSDPDAWAAAWSRQHSEEYDRRKRGAIAPRSGPQPGSDPWIWGGFQEQIQKYGGLSVYNNGVPAAWNLSSAAKMWDGSAGVKVGPWINDSPNNGAILAAQESNTVPFPSIPNWVGYYSGQSIWLKRAWRESGRASNVLRAVAAHEVGHALGLGHVHHANSIMNPTIGGGTYVPTAFDITNLQRLYPGGTGKVTVSGSSNDTVGVGGWLAEQLKKVITAPIDAAKKTFEHNKFVQLPLGIADRFVSDAIDFAVGGSGGDSEGPAGTEQVTKWMTQALRMKGMFSESNLRAGVARAMHESGGDPGIVQGNIGDINNLTGNLARGLMQVVPTTFAAFKEPGHDDIFNPIDNILASINYTIPTWGSLIAGWGDLTRGYSEGGYVVPALFDDGGWLTEGVQLIDHQRSKPDAVLTNEQFRDFHALASTVRDGDRGAPLVGVLQALDVDDALRKLYQTKQKEEFLHAS